MQNIRLKIAYDGSKYLGWQRTKIGLSIEETLQNALEIVFQYPLILQAASRTDAGVHAKGQVVNFLIPRSDLNLNKLLHNLNNLLPKEIVGLEMRETHENFHPTLDCIGKEYHYHICFGSIQNPLHRLYSWHYPHPLDINLIKLAGKAIEGKRDFSVFCNNIKTCKYDDFIREVSQIEVIELAEQRLRLVIKGHNFLYKMVRNIAGTLAYIGSKKIDLDQLTHILESQDRTLAGMTAPAQGLVLAEVFYP